MRPKSVLVEFNLNFSLKDLSLFNPALNPRGVSETLYVLINTKVPSDELDIGFGFGISLLRYVYLHWIQYTV